MFFFEKAFGDVEISYDKPDGKCLPNVEFFCPKCQIDFKKRFFRQLFFQKRSNGHIEWSVVFFILAKSCSPEVRETFLSDVGKSLKTYSFYFLYLPQSVSLESSEAIMLNLPINICHCPGIFPSSSVVIYSHFFSQMKILEFFFWTKRIRFYLPYRLFCQISGNFLQTGANCSWNYTN